MAFHAPFSRTLRPPFGPGLAVPGSLIVYLLKDEFTTPASAPLISPRICEPGPGILDIVDSGNKLSISSGKLTSASATVNLVDPRVSTSVSYTRVAGLAIFTRVNLTRVVHVIFGATNDGTGATGNGASLQLTQASARVSGATIGTSVLTITTGVDYNIVCVLRDSGAFSLIKGGAEFPEWTMLWVEDTITSSPVYGLIGPGSVAAGFDPKIDRMIVALLPSPWQSLYGIASSVVAAPVVGTSITSAPNDIIKLAWGTDIVAVSMYGSAIRTAVGNAAKNSYTSASFNASATIVQVRSLSATLLELDVRRTDVDNAWIIRCDQIGSTIKLIERNGGIETERSSAAQAWTGGGISDLICWPRIPDAAALSALGMV